MATWPPRPANKRKESFCSGIVWVMAMLANLNICRQSICFDSRVVMVCSMCLFELPFVLNYNLFEFLFTPSLTTCIIQKIVQNATSFDVAFFTNKISSKMI